MDSWVWNSTTATVWDMKLISVIDFSQVSFLFQRKDCVSITRGIWVTLLRELLDVCHGNSIKHYTRCIKMIGAVWKLIIFTSMVKRLINTSKNERVTLQVYDTCLQMFLFFGLWRKDCLTRSTLSSDTRGRPTLFPLQRHPVVWNCWYQRLMLLVDGGSLLNCRRSARWTETTDSCFTKCSTQNAFCSGFTIIALLRHIPREKRGVGLRMRTELEHLLFRSMWETYFCVRFESRNGRLKLLQSFWYTLYYCVQDVEPA